MITFRRAPLVSVGDKTASPQNNPLAEAINDRMRAGLDCTFRMWFKALNITRNVRNPVGDAYASALEFMSHFLHVAKGGEGTWPDAAPGGDGGANVVNPLMAFVFGSAGVFVTEEAGRLAGDDGPTPGGSSLPFEVGTPTSAIGIWELGKIQRGAVDLTTGSESAPAMNAARAHRRIGEFFEQVYGYDRGINTDITTASHLKKYGGTLPRQAVTGVCGDDSFTFTYEFTSLRGGPAKSYARSCGSNLRIYLYRDHYLVVNHDGSTERLDCNDYVHGPFAFTPMLEHPNGAMLDEAICEYLATFKGTDAQRARDDGYGIRDVAFDFQRFFSEQYWLAPAQGHVAGSELIPDYPLFVFNPGEDNGLIDGSLITFENKTGFKYIGCLLTAYNVPEAFTIQVRTGTTVHQTVSVPVGDTQKIVWMNVPANIGTFECAAIPPLGSGGTCTLEAAMLEDRRPELCDAYLVIRRGLGGSETGANASAVAVGEDYFTNRCLRTDAEIEQDTMAASENPVVEAVRKTFRENMRLLTRPELRGYAVEGGKSVLWFARKLVISGLEFDIWDGVAPPLESIASGQLLGGVEYRVTVDSITYNDVTVAAGETFTAIAGLTTYTGSGEVRQVNGILPNAPPNGLSNEWLMFVGTNVYNDSQSSTFKPEQYGDVSVGLHNRCKFFVDAADNDLPGDLMTHAAPGQPVPIMAESASQFNYWRGSNSLALRSDATRAKFFSSCQVYPADYECESVTMDEGQVKVTFKTRFTTASGAPAGDFGRDVAAWDRAAVGAEETRSDENAVREYLIYASGFGNCTVKAGDAGNGVNMAVNGYNVNGCCHPRFFFTRLMPKVWVETPDTEEHDDYDTRMFSEPFRWMTWTVDAICEGFINPLGGGGGGCPKQPPATYTTEALYLQASANTGSVVEWNQETGEFDDDAGGVWTVQGRDSVEDEWQTVATIGGSPYVPSGFAMFRLLRTATGQSRWVNLLTASANPDKSESFGPMPNTLTYAEMYDQLSAAINLLTAAPVYVPAAIERRRVIYTANPLEPGIALYNAPLCSPGNPSGVMIGARAEGLGLDFDPEMVFLSATEWVSGLTSFQAQATGTIQSAQFNGNEGIRTICTGPNGTSGARRAYLTGRMEYDELRITPNAHLSILPARLHDNLDDSDLSYTVSVTRSDIWQKKQTAPPAEEWFCGSFYSGISKAQFENEVTVCKILDFNEAGNTSISRYLREDSPTVGTPLVPSDYLFWSARFDTNCSIGPSSSVTVALNGYPFCVLNFPLA